jgi:hypothetical protein
MTIDEQRPLLPIGNVTNFANYGFDERLDLTLELPILVGEQPYPGEYTDPVANGAFGNGRPEALPTAESVRIPIHVRLSDGYETDGAEFAHPLSFASWTDVEIRSVVEALLRILGVRAGEKYAVTLQWSEGEGAVVQIVSGSSRAETDYVPIPFTAVAKVIGHDELPPKGIATHEDILRFND